MAEQSFVFFFFLHTVQLKATTRKLAQANERRLMLRHHTPTKQSTATELSTSASNFLNEGLQSKIQATKTKKVKGEKIYSCAPASHYHNRR